MRNYLAAAAMAVFSTAALTSPLWADGHEAVAGDIRVSAPMLRATPPNAPVAGGFVTLENRGDADDVLVSAAVDAGFVGAVELHEMTMADGVMSMSEVEGGIAIPAGETVALVPGGLHLMLMGLAEPLVAGTSYDVTLTFAEAGTATLRFPVMTLGEIRAAVEAAAAMDRGN